MEEDKPIRRRTRITQKKEDHVYQANTDGQGERFDTDEQKKAAKKAAPAIFAVDPATLVPPRKNRGRPSKAYLEAMEEYNRQLSLFESLKEEHLINDSEQQETEVQKVEADLEESQMIEAPEAEEPEGGETAKGIETPDFIIISDLPSVEEEREKLIVNSNERAQAAVTAEDSLEAKDSDSKEQEAKGFESKGMERATTGFKLKPAATSPIAEMMSINVCGVLELEKDNSGFLRSADYNYLPSPDDVSVTAQQVRQFALHTGDTIEGTARLPRGSEKAYVLQQIDKVNGLEAKRVRDRAPFESLTPLFPDEKFKLCSGEGDSMSCRIVDLISPIGKGQRALIVAQPKTGKTLLMKDVANAIAKNHPDSHLIMLLIDERPEEVTDMARTVNAEVIASTFDEPASQHVRIANIVLEKAKRMVECGHDVVIFLDSITRLARAYNTVAPTSGKILSGGVEANALQKPKRFFGAARNIEGGGSLTIIATALIDTGSKMDEVIFEEFKGTGNMELQLDRALANKRIFPAVNLTASSTRRDELLLDEMTTGRMWVLRNYIADMNPIEAMKFLKQRLEVTKNNEEFIISINS